MSKDKLVIEVVAAHNLQPKDGQGSSSPFVEVHFENQRLRTQSKLKDLNPVWNEMLVFNIGDLADLPYRTIELNIYNEKKSGLSRNFLGKVRISGSSVPPHGQEVAQLCTLEKRSLFSHIRGEITLKVYHTNDPKIVAASPGGGSVVSAEEPKPSDTKKEAKAQKQQQQQLSSSLNQQQAMQQQGKAPEQKQSNEKPPVIVAAAGPIASQPPPQQQQQPSEYSLKETKPQLGGGALFRDKSSWTYDLVEQMQYLYVRVVKARDLLTNLTGGCDAHVEVKVGNYRGVTKPLDKRGGNNLEWNQVFAFSKDCIQYSMVEVAVKEKDDTLMGRVAFDLSEVPRRVPPDSPLAPQWYRLEGKGRGEVMVSVWMGTQADEAFSEAWHSKAAAVHTSDGLAVIKSKVYLSPKLWYLRVGVIEAQDLLQAGSKNGAVRYAELSVKLQLGNQVAKTRPSVLRNSSPRWNEDLMFVAAEPFEDSLMIVVEDRVSPNQDEVLGGVLIRLATVEQRTDDRTPLSRWFTLDKQQGLKPSSQASGGGRIHLRMCLDGGYHVLDESAMHSSDLRPTAKQLWKPHIGVLEMGILGADSLLPMKIKDGNGTTDAYCVAKYGQKWVRTRTVVDSLMPKWNEQYTWEVFDPCTVVTIGVFDNGHLHTSPGNGTMLRDSRIGKVRIRLSTLESDRVYTHSYPLLLLHSSGVKKMGELHLALRFSCSSLPNALHLYMMPLLPKMHYLHPLSVAQVEALRYQAMNMVAMRLGRAEPPLWREVVEYMLDLDSHMWSMRRSKANFFRLMSILSCVVGVGRSVESVCGWRRPVVSTLVLVIFLIVVCYPELALPTLLMYLFMLGLWRFRRRPRHPPHMDTRLSHADSVSVDELDEEFDTFPTSRSSDVVRMRYDRLRSVAGRIQTVVGDMATQGERLQSLLSWRDPRATSLFLTWCLAAAIVSYAVPFQLLLTAAGLYALRPPKFRSRLPSPALNFFRRLSARADSLL
ncbi:hypothetical protein AMTRI_Chr07g78610 [Amborella trichopoda]|uniref:C2 domain-containing protein n=1 Tax=Amborella trichopoda TaxID=13333 RepID=W1PS85_AMBTC|nr:FT-interacting protein 1 [Amborella trichopoda]ERN12887.1 hypothetical protein AMTR_s00050p00157870 [Amborella trichopoda]|eukprot:XP_006851306.1 FT-interacting protein 1 [Amborella trichopoda]